MAVFTQRKPKKTRTAPLRPSVPLSRKMTNALRDSRMLLQLLLAAYCLIGLILVTEAWRAPFTVRLGDRYPRGITARVKFNRVDEAETERARNKRSEEVPFIFIHDPEPLKNLPARLSSQLREVAEADMLMQLSPETRTAFGLITDETQANSDESLEQKFATIKAAVTSGGDTVASSIEQIVTNFERFIEPLEEYGLANPSDFKRHNISSERTIAIAKISPNPSTSESGLSRPIPPADVLLPELIKNSGLLGKQWATFPNLLAIRPFLEQWLLTQVPYTLQYDSAATQLARNEARNSVSEIIDPYFRGDVLVEPNEPVDEVTLDILQSEYEAIQAEIPLRVRLVRVAMVFLLLLLLCLLVARYLLRYQKPLVNNISRLAAFLTLLIVTVGLGRILSADSMRAEIIPLTVAVMMIAIAYNQMLATVTAFTLSLILTLSTVADFGTYLVLMGASVMAAIMLNRVTSRSRLIKVGVIIAGVSMLVTWGTIVVQGNSMNEILLAANIDSEIWKRGLWNAGCCLLASYLVVGSLPFVESAFGVVTDISLLEMSDISHPILQEMVQRAPGTYNHSITVASIAENAAEEIGANGLLVRVGAYFHDIGKMLKPQYFIENMTEGLESRHEHLAPAMSTLIIIGHVKDGVDLARQYNIPESIIDFIEQHHGTTLVEYFYREAAKQVDQEPDHRTNAEESSFRYPGPKPQTPETGVLMLADAVESASRTLSEPTPKRLETLVHNLTMKRLLDGQFDECSLTLSQIHKIEESLVKSLIAIYHGRIKYPEQRTA